MTKWVMARGGGGAGGKEVTQGSSTHREMTSTVGSEALLARA